MTARTSPSWARADGPLAPYAGGFRVELERLGYTPLTAATHVRLMAHLSRWLAREGAEASGLTPALALRGCRHDPRGRVADRDRADAAACPPAHDCSLREGRRRGAAPAGPALAR